MNTTTTIDTPLDLSQIPVTVYKNANDKVGTTTALDQILRWIRDDKEASAFIARLRELYWKAETSGAVTDKENYNQEKRKLPAFTISGSFSKRGSANLTAYSHLIQADFDHLESKGVDIGAFRKTIERDPSVVFTFESPSGDGLKVGFLVDSGAEDHAEAFITMQQYCLKQFGLSPDSKCKDLTRLCFLSSDPEVFINEEASALDWRYWAEQANGAGEEVGAVALPLDAFPTIIQKLATGYAEVSQVDPALVATSALTVLSASLGKAVECVGAVSGRSTPCNLYSVISASSGYGKGVVGYVARPLTSASDEMVKQFEERDRPRLAAKIAVAEAQKKEVLAKLKGDQIGAAKTDRLTAQIGQIAADIQRYTLEKEHAPVLYTGSATGAALGIALKRNDETLLSFALEAGDAIRVAAGLFNHNGKADYDLLLSGYSGEPFSDARVTRDGLRLAAPCLGLLWCVQPALLNELYNTAEAQDRGLLARINLVRCDDDVAPLDDGIVREVSAALEDDWNDLILAALNLRKSKRKITFIPDRGAIEVFRGWHNEAVTLRNGPGRESEAKLKRCRENAIRIALNIAAAEWLGSGAFGDRIPLTGADAARGVVIAEYFLAQALHVSTAAVAAKRQERLNEILALVRNKGGSITLRHLRDHHNIGEAELGQIVSRNVDKLRIVEIAAGPSGGRPSRRLVAI